MARKPHLQYIFREDYQGLLEKERRSIKRAINEYTQKVTIVSALDGAINYRWSQPDSVVKVTSRDRFPSIGGFTPDFMFKFDNGYSLVGEYKLQWHGSGKDSADLQQLSSYVSLNCSNPTPPNHHLPPTRPLDVLLIVGTGSDEDASDAIANSTLNGLGSGAIIVTEAQIETQIENGDFVRFVYRKHGGNNGTFSNINAGQPNTSFDLNEWFVVQKRFSGRYDAEALAAAGECPFVNDTPPEPYSVVKLLLPALSARLSEPERDEIATGNQVDAEITVDEAVNYALQRYPRVPLGKCRSWVTAALRELVLNSLARSSSKEGVTVFSVTLDDRLYQLSEERLATRLARGRMNNRYVVIKREPDSDQLSFDYDPS